MIQALYGKSKVAEYEFNLLVIDLITAQWVMVKSMLCVEVCGLSLQSPLSLLEVTES